MPISFFYGVIFSIYLNAKTCKNKSGIMAKLKSPLLSFEAHGVLGDVLVFFTRGGTSYVRSKPQDPVSLSIAQGLLRDCFASAAVSAHSLTQGQKDFYTDLAPDSAFCPWWNNFIGQYIKDNYEAPVVAGICIKSLQFVTPTILDGEQFVDFNISSVDVTKSVFILLGCEPVDDDPRNFMHSFNLQTSTTARCIRAYAPLLGNLIAHAFIVEFEPAFIASFQKKDFTLDIDEAEILVTLDPVNLSKTVLFPWGYRCYGEGAANIYLCRADLRDNTTLRLRRNATGATVDGRIAVVEFT